MGDDLAIAGNVGPHPFENVGCPRGGLGGEEGEELLAACACDQDALVFVRPQRIDDRTEGQIALAMAQFIVDRLEIVDIDDRHGKDAVRASTSATAAAATWKNLRRL